MKKQLQDKADSIRTREGITYGEYARIHYWVHKNYGKASKCEGEDCKKISKNFQWANKSRKYLKDRSDWLELCVSCHARYDFTEEKREKLRVLNLGRKHSPETLEKKRLVQLGKKLSPEIRKKVSETRIKRRIGCKKVYQYDKSGNFIRAYDSINEAHDATGTDACGIGLVCSGKYKTSGRFKWSYQFRGNNL